MIYLIGGAPRTGKTSLAKTLLAKRRLPFVSTDVITHALGRAYPSTLLCDASWNETPDLFLPFLLQFIHYTRLCLRDFVIEGAAIFPTQFDSITKEPGLEFRCCFLGASEIKLDDILGYASIDNWVDPLSDSQKHVPARIKEFSQVVQTEAAKRGLAYFDVSLDRTKEIKRAYDFLLNSQRAFRR